VPSVAILDDGLIPRSEHEPLHPCGRDQEPIRGIPVRLSGQESALCSYIFIERD
jgi:hypothetical protein